MSSDDGERRKNTEPDESADSLQGAIGEGLAAAARKSGLGQLADGEGSTGRALLGAMGGFRGLAESILPGLVFLVLFTFTSNVPLSLGCSVGVAIIFTIVRLIGRTPVTQAVAGLILVGASAILALITGRAENNFILGFWVDGACAAAILISLLARWPLIGLIAGYLVGDGTNWRENKSQYRAMRALSLLWLLLFVARLAVQLPFYFAHTDSATSALALARLLMGVPLYAPLVLVSWFIVRSVFNLDQKKTTSSDS